MKRFLILLIVGELFVSPYWLDHLPCFLNVWNKLVCARQAEAAELFRKDKDYLVGPSSGPFTSADLDGDGYIDLATINFFQKTFSILYNRGDGSFELNNLFYKVGEQSWAIISEDFNGDSRLDIAVANFIRQDPQEEGPFGDVFIYINQGDRTFTGPFIYGRSSSTNAGSLYAVDLDKDGDKDLVVGSSNEIFILWNEGTGEFHEVTTIPIKDCMFMFDVWIIAISGGDVDRDGDIDIVAYHGLSQCGGRGSKSSIYLLKNEGNRRFSLQVLNDPYGYGDVNDIKLLDVDGDGDLDIVRTAGCSGCDDILVFLNNGRGEFLTGDVKVYKVGGRGIMSLAIGDFDRDGDPDLVTSNYGSNSISVLLNPGNGIFDEVITYPTGRYPFRVRVDDYDNDSDLDIAVVTKEDKAISIFLNNTVNDIITGVVDIPLSLSQVPDKLTLYQNYPNPFNNYTNVTFDLPRLERIRLSVYNTSGRKVGELLKAVKPAGSYLIKWDGKDQKGGPLPTGVYFYMLEVGEIIEVRRMLIIR